MCRLLLIISNDVSQYNNNLILEFLKQSITKKNTPNIISKRDGDFHKDGFGFAWHNSEKSNWKIYKNPLEYTKVLDLSEKINLFKNNILIGHLRKRCCKSMSKISYNNTHPFTYKQHVWCHNGCICNFNPDEFKLLINKNFKILGKTDSEHLFYFFLTILSYKKNNLINNLIDTTIEFFTFLKKYKNNTSANIIYSNKQFTLISRFINTKEEPASLYHNQSDDIIISSEPLLKNFKVFPKNNVWIIDKITKELLIKIDLSKF